MNEFASHFYSTTKDKWLIYLFNCYPNMFENENVNEVELRFKNISQPKKSLQSEFYKLLNILKNNPKLNYTYKEYKNIIIQKTGTRCTIEDNNYCSNCIKKKKGNLDFNFVTEHPIPYGFRISFASEINVPIEDYKDTQKIEREIKRHTFKDNWFYYELSEVKTPREKPKRKISRVRGVDKTKETDTDITYEFEIELINNNNLRESIRRLILLTSYLTGYKIIDYKSKSN